MFLGCDRFKIVMSDHASITNEHKALEPEALVQVANRFLYCPVVHLVACPDVMGDRPAGHHHNPDDHLDIVRLAIPAIAVLGEVGWSGTLEVGAGNVIEHQVGLEAEQVAETVIKSQLDPSLGGHELIERSIPGFQLAEVNADSLGLVPAGNEPSAPSITDEVGLQPAGQAVFASGMNQAIGDQNKGPVGKRHPSGFAQCRVQDGPQSQLVKEGPDRKDWSPGGGIDDVQIVGVGGLRAGVLAQQTLELGEDFGEEVFATQVSDGALLDLAVLAIGFDDTDILINRAAGGSDFDGSQVHVVKYHDVNRRIQGEHWDVSTNTMVILSLRFSENKEGVVQKTLENKPDPRTRPPRRGF